MSYQDYMNLLFQYPCGCEVVQDDDGKDADLYPVFQYPCGCEVVR